ncbi:DUF6314 family protein [Yoonia sp. SS1-5]|uniref:DUF6314 family protein n=1 Tax=Yoonia rhodophyticola TaxID=3137370 RepID=A0AAN0M6N2_9RHOB
MLKPTDFIGEWSLDRQITDKQAAQAGQMKGRAVFTELAADRLRYDETGTLQMGQGPQMAATRSYIWVFTETGVDMQFADGGPFHSFVPQGYVSGTDHLCGEDTYTVRYDFVHWPRWRAVWVVNGPRKNYTAITEFLR